MTVARSFPLDAGAIGVPVGPKGAVPRRSASIGDARRSGSTARSARLRRPPQDGADGVAVGIGEAGDLDARRLRDAAAAFARAAASTALATTLADVAGATGAPPQAVVEGVLLARYRFGVLKNIAGGRR